MPENKRTAVVRHSLHVSSCFSVFYIQICCASRQLSSRRPGTSTQRRDPVSAVYAPVSMDIHMTKVYNASKSHMKVATPKKCESKQKWRNNLLTTQTKNGERNCEFRHPDVRSVFKLWFRNIASNNWNQ